MTPLQHWFSAQCNHFSGSGLMASCEEWNGSGVWHSDGKPSHLSHSGWKGKNLSKGDRGWQSPWTSRQSLGSRQNSPRLQRTGPSVASSFSWNYISFSSPSASSSESASTLAVHDQTERPISSWVSESLDMVFPYCTTCCGAIVWSPFENVPNVRGQGSCHCSGPLE